MSMPTKTGELMGKSLLEALKLRRLYDADLITAGQFVESVSEPSNILDGQVLVSNDFVNKTFKGELL